MRPQGTIFDPDNGYIYVANQLSPSVSIIDGSKNQVIGTITGIPNPIQLSYNRANRDVYVVNYDNTNVVSVIDTRTNSVIGTIPGFSNPGGVGYDSANGNMYLANQGSNFISIVSGQTNKVIGTVTVGSGPVNPVFDPVNHNFYVADFHSNEQPGNTVAVISTTSAQPPPVQNSGTTLSTSIQFPFTATAGTNPIAGFECRLDNSAFSPCSSPTTLTNLPAGKHNFQARAVDTGGNRDPTPASFSWTLLTPAQGIQQLIQLIQSMGLNHGTQTSLTAPLNGALSQLTKNNPNSVGTTCNQLNAFVNHVNADGQNGQLSSNQAAQLIQSAQNIQKALGCTSGNGIVVSSLSASLASPLNFTQSQQSQQRQTASYPSLL
jgi:YVTN family beta-propeller protein